MISASFSVEQTGHMCTHHNPLWLLCVVQYMITWLFLYAAEQEFDIIDLDIQVDILKICIYTYIQFKDVLNNF